MNQSHCYLQIPRCSKFLYYRTAGNIGGELNLAVWRLGKRPSNLNPSTLSAIYMCACAHIICTELPPNLNPPIFLFRPLGTKPPNLKIANISGYTVYNVSISCNELLVVWHTKYSLRVQLSRSHTCRWWREEAIRYWDEEQWPNTVCLYVCVCICMHVCVYGYGLYAYVCVYICMYVLCVRKSMCTWYYIRVTNAVCMKVELMTSRK